MKRICTLALFAPFLLCAAEDRITKPLDGGRTVALKGHVNPLASAANDRGRVARGMELSYVTLLLKPAPGLEAFLAEQQNPASPHYRNWLTPEDFADRFGLTRADIDKISGWLKSQGLQVHDVARGRHWITFSGTAESVGNAFKTEIHRFEIDGETHYANAGDPSVPEAFAAVVAGFLGLDDIRLKPNYILRPLPNDLSADYSSGGAHFLAPGDLATIYDVAPLYAAGIDGTGQKIVVIGQTEINVSDIQKFRTRFGLPPNDPQKVLFGRNPGINGDLIEADLDLEWSGAIAYNAQILYAYASRVETAAAYAVDRNLAPVMSLSYGLCEAWSPPELRYIAQQANAQGITWVASSGDQSSAECDRNMADRTPLQAAKGPTIGSPASFPEVTAVGGTQFDDSGDSYWNSRNAADGSSAKSYIPELPWNEAMQSGTLAGSGGGASAFFEKPAWQTGPGVPAMNARMIPDVSLPAAGRNAYLIYYSGSLGGVGGTSAGAPAFAGMVALLNQYLVSKGSVSQPGLGNINPMLYRLAQGVPDAFHDVTSGDIRVPCVQASAGCMDGLVGFAAGPGYDLATGLGSIDANNLITKWDSGAASTTTLTASPSSISLGDSVLLRAVVTANGGHPTGTVSFLSNVGPTNANYTDLGGNRTLLGTVALNGDGVAELAVAALQLAAGDGNVTALYNGDGVLNASAGNAVVTLNLPTGSSLVVPSITPNPVHMQTLVGDPEWDYVITLSEKAGTSTRLTKVTVDGQDHTADIAQWFGTSIIRPNTSLFAGLSATGLTPPVTRTYVFEGLDNNGTTWSRQLTVDFVGPAGPSIYPAMTLTAVPATTIQNTAGDGSCRLSHRVYVHESGGFLLQLTHLTAGSVDLSSQIQSIFGTTRLAPLGSLQGTICWADTPPADPVSYVLTADTEYSFSVTTTLDVPGTVMPGTGPALAASPAVITIPLADSSSSGSATLALNAGGPAQAWSISVLPASGAANWLTVTPVSGTGNTQISLKASGSKLSRGVYSATLAVSAPGSATAYISVPVLMVIGASQSVSIGAAINNFSGQAALAPGSIAAIYGSGLAPDGTFATAGRLPLPFSLAGVSATVNGISAPLYFAAPGQIDIQIPYEAGAGPAVLAIDNNGQVAAYPLDISIAAPGIAAGPGGALFPATAQRGQSYSIYVTGDGDANPTLATGAAPAFGTATSKLPKPRLPLKVTIGGVDANIAFAGIPTWGAGVTQINFTVPNAAPLGTQQVIVTAGGIPSAPATVTVQ